MPGAKVIVFLSSVREGRNASRVATFIIKHLKNAGLDVTVFDPLEMNIPLIQQPLHFYPDRSQAPQWMQDANEQIKASDGFVVITSEYNCGTPPALSNMLDHFPPASFKHRPCCLCTYSMGHFGGVRLSTLILPFLHEFGFLVQPKILRIPTVHTAISPEGEAADEDLAKRAELFTQQFSWYVEAIKQHKEKCEVPL